MDCCEDNGCKRVGIFGHEFFIRQRRLCMGFCTFMFFLIFVLVCVGYAGTSANGETLRNSAWTVELDATKFDSSYANSKVIAYFGLKEAFLPSHNVSGTDTTANSSSAIEEPQIMTHSAFLTFVDSISTKNLEKKKPSPKPKAKLSKVVTNSAWLDFIDSSANHAELKQAIEQPQQRQLQQLEPKVNARKVATNSAWTDFVESLPVIPERTISDRRKLSQSVTILDETSGTYVTYTSCSQLPSSSSSATDDLYLNFQQSACSACHTAGRKVAAATGISIFFSIVLFTLQSIRICMDRVVFKVTLLVFSWMLFVSLACAMGIWKHDCEANLSVFNSDYKLWAGPGYNCVAAAFVFNIFAFIVNLLTPSKDPTMGHNAEFTDFHNNPHNMNNKVPPPSANVAQSGAMASGQPPSAYRGVIVEDEV